MHESGCECTECVMNETNVRTMKVANVLKCKFAILMPDHYREDGSCKCDDPDERKKMIAEWDYTKADFKGIKLRKK